MARTYNFIGKLYSHIVSMYYKLKERYSYVRFSIMRIRGGICFGYFTVTNDYDNIIAL